MMVYGMLRVMTGKFWECCLRALCEDTPKAEPWSCKHCGMIGKLEEDGCWDADVEASMKKMNESVKAMTTKDIAEAFGLTEMPCVEIKEEEP